MPLPGPYEKRDDRREYDEAGGAEAGGDDLCLRGPKIDPLGLAPIHETLMRALTVDARRPKKERRTAWMLLEEIQAAGYDGCYSRVTDFIRAWRHGAGKTAPNTAFVPLHFDMGE